MNNSQPRRGLVVAAVMVCCLALSSASSDEPQRQIPHRRELTTNSIGVKLVQLPAGEFDMGAADSNDLALANESPRHRVRITRPFMIGIHEVSVGEFRAFVDATGYVTAAETGKSSGFIGETHTFQYDQQGYNWKNLGWKQTDDHPALNVNWFDVDGGVNAFECIREASFQGGLVTIGFKLSADLPAFGRIPMLRDSIAFESGEFRLR